MPLVFNPFSILNCLDKGMMENYWVISGTPKVFVDYLSKSEFDLLELENLWVTKVRMEGTYSTEDPIPLLFQTGYLTIAEVRGPKYRLKIPNGEVRSALVDDLIPRYMGVSRNRFDSLTADLWKYLDTGNADGIMTVLQQLVARYSRSAPCSRKTHAPSQPGRHAGNDELRMTNYEKSD